MSTEGHFIFPEFFGRLIHDIWYLLDIVLKYFFMQYIFSLIIYLNPQKFGLINHADRCNTF